MLVRLPLVATLSLVVACASAVDDEGSDEDSSAIQSSPVADPRATVATRTVRANLASMSFESVDPFDHRVLIGQQEADVSNRETNGLSPIDPDIARVTGRAPALVSYELSASYRHALTMFDVDSFRAGLGPLRDRVRAQHARGALVSFVWHLRCPKATATDRDRFAPSECPRDYKLDELLERASRGGRGAHFDEWRALLDALADFLWSLKDDNGELIPVLIRPFHEMTGGWFWWGRDNSGSSYGAAWREMVSYLRDGRGLHNVLWVFCPAAPTNAPSFEAYYPGDSWVDVVAFDRYDRGDGSFKRGFESDLRAVSRFASSHSKLAAVGEVGRDLLGVTPDPSWFTRGVLAPIAGSGRISYVAFWRNAPWEKFIPEPGDGAVAEDLRAMSRDERALMAGTHDLYRPLHITRE